MCYVGLPVPCTFAPTQGTLVDTHVIHIYPYTTDPRPCHAHHPRLQKGLLSSTTPHTPLGRIPWKFSRKPLYGMLGRYLTQKL